MVWGWAVEDGEVWHFGERITKCSKDGRDYLFSRVQNNVGYVQRETLRRAAVLGLALEAMISAFC